MPAVDPHAQPSINDQDPAVELINISRSFGALKAVDGVSLSLHAGSIHALLGENGAGKSTLMKILFGALQPDYGSIRLFGSDVRLPTPQDARAAGIGMVFQHFTLFDSMTVLENVALAMSADDGDLSGLRTRLVAKADAYNMAIDPDAVIGNLDVGERQRVEILRALLQEPRILILDEPTSVLTPQESDSLFVILHQLASEGIAILFISHRLNEVRTHCDHATIMRRGAIVGEIDPKAHDAQAIAEMMVGQSLSDALAMPARDQNTDGEALEARTTEPLVACSGLGGGWGSVPLHNVSFELREGQVLGIAGVAGNGQTSLYNLLSGEVPAQAGSLLFGGEAITGWSITQRREAGMAFVPEERHGHGAIPNFTLSDNVLLARHASADGVADRGVIKPSRLSSILARIVSRFDVRAPAGDPLARTLSGGNLQKLLMGRALDADPELLVVNQPTWGVDAASAAAIRQNILERAQAGMAVIVISQDLDEILEMSDAIGVLHHGALSPILAREDVTRERLGLWMTQGFDMDAASAGDSHAA